LPAAIQDRGVIEAEGAQHPPDPRRPLGVGGAVQDHAAVVADAMRRHCFGKLFGRRRHEP